MPLISVVLPCLNEEKSIGKSIQKILSVFKKEKIKGEIIVVDNGSTDDSKKIAKSYNITYIFEPKKGYGNAYRAGFDKVKGVYTIMGDADCSYDFSELPKLVKQLDKGHDFVIGTRLKGNIKKGAMPFTHRYVGTPLFNFLIWMFFKKKVSDCNSGFRGIRTSTLKKLKLKSGGMELASEMIIKAMKNNISIKEVPITYSKRIGRSKIHFWRDGWNHIYLIITYWLHKS